MGMLPTQFKADDYGDMDSFEALPAGEYNCQIVNAEMDLTKAAKEEDDPSLGQKLSIQFKVLDGDQEGKTFFRNLNLVHPNKQTVEIANKELATLCRSIGKAGVERTEELIDQAMRVKLIQKGKESDKYGIQNEVRDYSEYDGQAPASSKPSKGDSSGAPKKGRRW